MATSVAARPSSSGPSSGNQTTNGATEKSREVRSSNILAAQSISDTIRTSLGPKGMDKLIQTAKGEVILTNDGATILKHMAVMHPAAKMLVDLSIAQDAEAGDGTTTVAILAGSLLAAAGRLLQKGLHPTIISESFGRACTVAVEHIRSIAQAIEMSDTNALFKAAKTSLNSKIVSQQSSILAPVALDAVLKAIDPATATNVDLKTIRIVAKVGGTIDDTHLAKGLILKQSPVRTADGPTRMEKAKIALLQFQLSPPKPDMDSTILVNDYHQMDRILKEERQYLLNLCKRIKKSGANVVLIQKSILRDAVNDLALHFLAKLKILVIKNIERDEVEFICNSLGCKPVADIDGLTESKLGYADLVECVTSDSASYTQCTGIRNEGKCVSILVRGANQLVVEEAERSLHDALCVVRCLVKQKAIIVGGGVPEIEASLHLTKTANKSQGIDAIVFQAFAEALEVIPITLAENAGLNSLRVVTELRSRHEAGEKQAGINVRKGTVSNLYEENVVQPLLVTISAFQLAVETVQMILKVDDVTLSR